MAKSKKRALEGAWPSLDLRCIDLDFTFLSDRVHVSLRLAVYVRFHYVPICDLSLKRSMFFCFLFLALPGECDKASPGDDFLRTQTKILAEIFPFFFLSLLYSLASFLSFLLFYLKIYLYCLLEIVKIPKRKIRLMEKRNYIFFVIFGKNDRTKCFFGNGLMEGKKYEAPYRIFYILRVLKKRHNFLSKL